MRLHLVMVVAARAAGRAAKRMLAHFYAHIEPAADGLAEPLSDLAG